MRAWLCALVLTVAMVAPALAGPEEDALQVVGKWVAAFNASDLDAIVALYAPDAMFLGTGSRTVVLNTAEIRQYFERALLTGGPHGTAIESRSVMVLSDGAVAITGLDATSAVRDGKTISSPGRVTFVIASDVHPPGPCRDFQRLVLRSRLVAIDADFGLRCGVTPYLSSFGWVLGTISATG